MAIKISGYDTIIIEDASIEELLYIVQMIADTSFDGHFTIMRFTCHWKVMLGTPDLRTGQGFEEVLNRQEYRTFKQALLGAIRSHINIPKSL